MAASPTVRQRQLGMELERLRKAAGKNQREAGEWLDIVDTNISRMEHGKQRVSLPQLRSLLQLYQVGSPDADYLFRLRAESEQRGWWVEYGRTVPKWFGDYVGMETAAAEVWTYESEFIPGLLQTPDYTRAISAALHPTRTSDEAERVVQLRADRQRRLTDDEPLILHAVINEAALRREVGGSDVMRAQLKRLAELSLLPNVTIQVLPFVVGAHRGMSGPFTALRFREEPALNTVYLEGHGTALYVEGPGIADYAERFESLADEALNWSEWMKGSV